jgi:hypothetical protein
MKNCLILLKEKKKINAEFFISDESDGKLDKSLKILRKDICILVLNNNKF